MQIRRNLVDAARSTLLLALETCRQAVDLVSDVLFQRREPLFQISAQLGRLGQELGFQASKTPFVVPNLRAEKYVPDLVETLDLGGRLSTGGAVGILDQVVLGCRHVTQISGCAHGQSP
ncbi:MAG: hypothetical protein U0361_11430 [Nitrospiraceae bacterium]